MHWVLIVRYANLHLHVPLPCPPSRLAPALPPAWPGPVSVWQALGPVRQPVGCDGQQLCVPLPAVWHPLGSCPGAQAAKVTSLQLSQEKKKETLTGHSFNHFLLCPKQLVLVHFQKNKLCFFFWFFFTFYTTLRY